MKKILLASTALVMTAGAAAADLAISGSAQMGLEFDDSAVEETTYNAEVGVTFDMSGETDGGLSFGATTIHLVSQNGTVDNDDTWVWVSAAGATASMGAVTEADRLIGLPDLGLDGLGFDDVVEGFSGDDLTVEDGSNAANTNLTYAMGAITVAVSGAIGDADDPYSVGGKYDAGTFAVAIGYGDDGAGNNATTAGLTGSFGPVALTGLYTDNDLRGEAYGVTAAYEMGAATVTVGYADNDEDTDASYGVGVAYDLGGGATLKGAVGSIDDTTKADLGIAMSF